jgi:phospholipase/carboxylesterase
MSSLSFVHRFAPATAADAPPLLLLHGTGGDENDLLPLGKTIAPGAALLSPRGKVLEHGMPRFFRRLAEGVFDEDDVRRRAEELADFIGEARSHYGLPAPVALGYSNGANIAAAVMLLRPEALAGGILLRAMVPFRQPPKADLAGKSVLIVSGAQDPIIPADNAARLATQLREAGATVDHRILPGGHMLSNADLRLSSDWLRETYAPAVADGGMR